MIDDDDDFDDTDDDDEPCDGCGSAGVCDMDCPYYDDDEVPQ